MPTDKPQKLKEAQYFITVQSSIINDLNIVVLPINNHHSILESKNNTLQIIASNGKNKSFNGISIQKDEPNECEIDLSLNNLNPDIKKLRICVVISNKGFQSFKDVPSFKVILSNKAGEPILHADIDPKKTPKATAMVVAELTFNNYLFLKTNRLTFTQQGFKGGLNGILIEHNAQIVQSRTINAPRELSESTDESKGTIGDPKPPEQHNLEKEGKSTPPQNQGESIKNMKSLVGASNINASQNIYEQRHKLLIKELTDNGCPENIMEYLKVARKVSKEKDMLGEVARFVIAIDCSSANIKEFEQGYTQKILELMAGFALMFSDDVKIDCWAYASKPSQLFALNLNNVQNYVLQANRGWQNWSCAGRYCSEVPALEAIKKNYVSKSEIPTFVLFLTSGDGGNIKAIQQSISSAANLPLFFQIVGLPSNNQKAFNTFKTALSKELNNRSYFYFNDIHKINTESFYNRLLEHYVVWLKNARNTMLVTKKQ